jgi:eukaryotic-like serine/threonine-protein kinase
VNPHRSSPSPGLTAGDDDDPEAIRVLDSYLSGIEAGQPPDPHKLLVDHPALADQLRAYLKVMHLVGRPAEGSAARPEVRPACRSTDGQVPPLAQGWERWGDQTPPGGSSQMATIDFGPGPPPHIRLRALLEDREPPVMPRSAAIPDRAGTGLERYQLQGEIARGGMGAIIRGRDVDLGRELAIKVLLESHQGNPEVVRRFVEEAQIGGQLQHPGVVPVYELGTFPDRRPYFAMKLVKGRTLAALLRERTGPAQDLSRFLGILEQTCYTVAYAHARGVIHRDLKPSNVMVGSFGEVQVMDWGLAKVLTQGGIADLAATQAVQETVVTTVRSGPARTDDESQAGSILGTPAYMAPEQARGEVERIDERADVFGLGAILCEILTGLPP